MSTFDKFIAVLGALFMLGASPFVIEHVQQNWDKPEYPYSGFTPDCPEWNEPLDERYLPRPQQDEEEVE